MTFAVTHAHVSAITDDGSDVGSNAWNAGHTISITTSLSPDSSDGAALGTSSVMWSDLFLASGGVINFNNGDVTITHAANALTLDGGRVGINTGGTIHSPAGSGTLELDVSIPGGDWLLVGGGYGTSAFGADIAVFKTRGADLATHTIVQSGDEITSWVAYGSDGAAYRAAASIAMEVDATPGASDMPGRIRFLTTLDGAATSTERMRIDNAGNVVINTAALATNAANGFLYIPTSAGTPTGTPTSYSGRVPMEYDTTNNKVYFYNSGWQTPSGASIAPLTLVDANTVDQRNSTTAQAFRVYNTYTDASNYERGVFDWTTSANTLTIGAQAAGTGTLRNVSYIASTSHAFTVGGTARLTVNGSNTTFDSGSLIGWGNAWLGQAANAVVGFSNGSGFNSGWFNFAGQTRVTADVSYTSTTTLAAVTGLSVTLQTGRTYTFEAQLQVTDAAAGGVKASIDGTATATAIQYTGWTVADNAIKGKANATALATTVGSTTTTETTGIVVQIYGTITCNVGGTLLVKAAQNTSNGTATIVKRGSYFYVYDIA